MQFFTGCWPYDNFGTNYELKNVAYSLQPEKEIYDLSDLISLTYSFVPDSDKFKEYVFYIL